MIWPHGEEILKEFKQLINNHHPTIKFTEEHRTIEIPFLDTTGFKENCKLKTKVYHKKQTRNNISITDHITQKIKKMYFHMDC